MLQPDIQEERTSLDQVELTDELLQGVRNAGRRLIIRGLGTGVVIVLTTFPGDGVR